MNEKLSLPLLISPKGKGTMLDLHITNQKWKNPFKENPLEIQKKRIRKQLSSPKVVMQDIRSKYFDNSSTFTKSIQIPMTERSLPKYFQESVTQTKQSQRRTQSPPRFQSNALALIKQRTQILKQMIDFIRNEKLYDAEQMNSPIISSKINEVIQKLKQTSTLNKETELTATIKSLRQSHIEAVNLKQNIQTFQQRILLREIENQSMQEKIEIFKDDLNYAIQEGKQEEQRQAQQNERRKQINFRQNQPVEQEVNANTKLKHTIYAVMKQNLNFTLEKEQLQEHICELNKKVEKQISKIQRLNQKLSELKYRKQSKMKVNLKLLTKKLVANVVNPYMKSINDITNQSSKVDNRNLVNRLSVLDQNFTQIFHSTIQVPRNSYKLLSKMAEYMRKAVYFQLFEQLIQLDDFIQRLFFFSKGIIIFSKCNDLMDLLQQIKIECPSILNCERVQC